MYENGYSTAIVETKIGKCYSTANLGLSNLHVCANLKVVMYLWVQLQLAGPYKEDDRLSVEIWGLHVHRNFLFKIRTEINS